MARNMSYEYINGKMVWHKIKKGDKKEKVYCPECHPRKLKREIKLDLTGGLSGDTPNP